MRLSIKQAKLCEKDEQLQLFLTDYISEREMPLHVAKCLLESKIQNKQNIQTVWKKILKLRPQTA